MRWQRCCETSQSIGHLRIGVPCLRTLCKQSSPRDNDDLFISSEAVPLILSVIPDYPAPVIRGFCVCLQLSWLTRVWNHSQYRFICQVCDLQVSAGFSPPQRSNWPRLQYVLKGIARCQLQAPPRRLPVTAAIMVQLQSTIQTGSTRSTRGEFACCLGYFGFMRSGDFTVDSSTVPAVCVSDVVVDSHSHPSLLKVKLRRAKTNPLGKGIKIFMSRTGTVLCPVAAILHYMAVHPKVEGSLLIHADGSPLTRAQFVFQVKKALEAAAVDSASYSGHSFCIASIAAATGIPVYFIKMLGRWESEAYHLYIRTPRHALAAVSCLITQ